MPRPYFLVQLSTLGFPSYEQPGRGAVSKTIDRILGVPRRRPGRRGMVAHQRGIQQKTEDRSPRKQRPLSITAIVILALAAFAGLAYYLGTPPSQPQVGSTNNNSTNSSQAVTIVIPNGVGVNQTLHFQPPQISVVIGVNNTIVWSDQDTSSAHDVISVSAPPNGPNWDFENMVAGKDYSVTLTVPGTYSYEMYLPYVVVGMIVVNAST